MKTHFDMNSYLVNEYINQSCIHFIFIKIQSKQINIHTKKMKIQSYQHHRQCMKKCFTLQFI